jgi:hypothetical protein
MTKTVKGGPATEAGKKISSFNALTHGLTGKRWSTPVEEEHYYSYLSALINDYQPETVIEYTLIEKLADARTRLDRFHKVENALFTLAQEGAGSSDLVIDSFGLDAHGISNELSEHAFGINKHNNQMSEELLEELIRLDQDEFSGWGYIMDNMPVLKGYVLEECRKEKVDVEGLMSRYKEPEDNLPTMRIIVHTSENSDSFTDEKLDTSGLKVRKEYFIAYIKALFKRTQRRGLVNTMMEKYDDRAELLKDSALPDGPSLDRLMRYRTTLERQFSKTLGELLHIINLREH